MICEKKKKKEKKQFSEIQTPCHKVSETGDSHNQRVQTKDGEKRKEGLKRFIYAGGE